MTSGDRHPGLSLRVSVTDRCPLRCSYCRPGAGALGAARDRILTYEQIANFVSVVMDRYAVRQVRITGGEPLARPQVERLVAMLAALGVPDLALTTNGQHLAGKAAILRRSGLMRINISLDSLDPVRFREITGGGVLEKTLAGIQAARDAGLHPIKLNTVVLRGRNDREVVDLVRFAEEQGAELRFLELMPIGMASAGFAESFVSSAEVRERLEEAFDLEPLPERPEDTSRDFVVRRERGGGTVIGFVSPYSQPFCAGCWRLRLTAAGSLIGCLARPQGIPLSWDRHGGSRLDAGAVCEAVDLALGLKRRDGNFVQPRHMVMIGG
ncbi:MAG: GTP 3',8-cyclase MoaA [Bryobacterales bacterium]|nr:GTP 3',8-cyclase MoaA [Bryobacterales bacterium]